MWHYTQLTRWCRCYLGKAVRVPLPSCAVTKIRTTFPSDDFCGFKQAPVQSHQSRPVITTALFRATKPQKKGSFQSHQTPKETKILLLFYARQCGWFLCLISKIYHYCEEIDNFQFTMVWIIQLTMKKGVEQICYKGGALDSSLFFRDGCVPQKILVIKE